MEEIFLKTHDNIKIAINYYRNNNDSVIIIAPGWCMTKNSKSFREISEAFSTIYDVITLDFRGHGRSKGLFTFTAKEIYDIESVINFAKSKNYKNIYLMGFSLGAGLSLICSSKNKNIAKVIAVSPYADFRKIENHMWKREAWGETFKKFELNRFLSIRPSIIPQNKIKPVEIIDKVTVPTLLIAGKKDPTIYPWHTELLYNKARCPKKLKIFENGYHAEDLFIYFKDEFVEICNDWLGKDKVLTTNNL